jgi:hypothetical protein
MKTFVLNILCFLFYSGVVHAQKTWIGIGNGGTGTDFNTAANWSPSGVPTATDNATIAITSDAIINLSANASVNSLTFTVNGNNDNARLYVGANTLTVNGNATIDVLSGNGNTDIEIGVNGGTAAGIIDFRGNVSIAPTNAGDAAGFAGNANSRLIFGGNLSFGVRAYINISNTPGTAEFNGTGTQVLTYNNTVYTARFNNVVIGNTNNPTVQMAGTATVDPIVGNLTVNGTSVLDLSNRFWNRLAAGGTFSLNSNSTLRLGSNTGGQTGSNFPLNFSTLSISSTSTVEYNSTSAQTIFDVASPGYGNLTVSNNSTKTAGGGLDVQGNLLINSTSNFGASTFTHNIDGNFTNNGTFTQGTSTIVLDGTVTQTIGGTAPSIFNNITFNKASGGVVLATAAAVNANATFTNGVVTTTVTNLLTMNAGSSVSGGSTESHVNGPMAKAGTTAFTFPVGNGTFYRAIAIGTPSASSTFRAQFFRANPVSSVSPYTLSSGLTRISVCEYWTLDRTAGTGNATVTLSWGASTGCGETNYVNDIPNLRVARHTGGSWVNEGNAATTGTNAAGTVTSNTVTTFSPFALGAGGSLNPLPVNFVNVTGKIQTNTAVIEWTNATEKDLSMYIVERSFDGRTFETAGTVQPKANNGNSETYSFIDAQPANISYYRIRAIENNGGNKTSSIIKLSKTNSSVKDITLYPNPVINKTVVLQSSNLDAGRYAVRLINSAGVVVFTRDLQLPVGYFVQTLQLPQTTTPGVYMLIIETGTFKKSIKLMIQ